MNLLNIFSFLLLIYSNISTNIATNITTKSIELTSNNMVSLRGPINAFSSSKFIHETSNIQSNILNIIINSPGGSISDGNVIIEQIKSLSRSNIRINCICDFAASMAFIIVQACPHRYGLDSSVLMQHQMALSIGGEINRINSYMTYIDSLKNSLDIIQSSRIGMKLSVFQEKVRDEWWIYGKDNINDAAIIEALEKSYAIDFVNDMPNGINTMIGENGVLLSGGQRQRLAIARAFLKNSNILIFDEATSSLDSVSEKYIQTALNELKLGKTTIIIAHRLSTVENANNIVVMDKGKIIESGSHKNLIGNKSYYYKLYNSQVFK